MKKIKIVVGWVCCVACFDRVQLSQCGTGRLLRMLGFCDQMDRLGER